MWAEALRYAEGAAAQGDAGSYMSGSIYAAGGRSVPQNWTTAAKWWRKVAEAGQRGAQWFIGLLVRFTDAGSAPTRHAVAHEFAGKVNEQYLGCALQEYNQMLQEDDSGVPHQSVRDSVWVDFMMNYGFSDEDLALAKRFYAYSQRTCRLCGSNAAPLRNCSMCMEVRYCIAGDCQHADWNKTPAAESHKVLCPRIFVRGIKGRTRRA
jgi:hypothetical protein